MVIVEAILLVNGASQWNRTWYLYFSGTLNSVISGSDVPGERQSIYVLVQEVVLFKGCGGGETGVRQTSGVTRNCGAHVTPHALLKL